METDYEGMSYAFSFIFYHFNDCDKFYFVQINQKMFSVSSHYCFYTFYLNLQMSFLWRVAAGSIRHWVRNSVIHEGFETPNSPQLKGSGLFSFGIWLGSLLGAYSVRYFRHIQLRGDPETDLGPYFYFFRICGNDDWKLVQNDLKNLQIFLKSTKKWKIKCVQSLICVVIFVQLCKSLPVKQNFNANFFAGFFFCSCVPGGIRVIEVQTEDITGLISSDLPPGCSHSHGSDSIWCAVPLNPILILAKPNRQLREPTTFIILKPLDQLQGKGGGSLPHWSLFAASPEQPLLCEIQERARRRE